MPLLSQKEVLKQKLSSVPKPALEELAKVLRVRAGGGAADLAKAILSGPIDEPAVDSFLKRKYLEKIEERRSLISDADLRRELMRVDKFSWGTVQGQLDSKIQTVYVRKIVHYDDLISSVRSSLHEEVTNYVVCSWFNHWTTVLLEEHISSHAAVVPTLKPIKGVDIFFSGQPFDLKVTYLPKDLEPRDAISHPRDVAIWMYENQGEQRFGADNRLFVVLCDTRSRDDSWKLKRDFDLVFGRIDAFFSEQRVDGSDEVAFKFKGKAYTAVTKVLLITP